MTVLANAGPYAMEEGRRCKLNLETSPWLGRHGAGGAMCQARIVWADWVIRQKVGKLVYLSRDFTGRTS